MRCPPLVLWLLLCSSALGWCARAADVYDLDPGVTQVGFDIERFGLHWVSAHFRDFQGAFIFDREGDGSRVDVTVRTESIDCGSSVWNPHLRSPEWLDTQQFPLMTYHSRHIRFEDGERAEADGDLTLHGVIRPVVLSVSDLQCPQVPPATGVCRFTAHASVRRSDFGLPHGFWSGGDQVQITISGIATRAQRAPTQSARR